MMTGVPTGTVLSTWSKETPSPSARVPQRVLSEIRRWPTAKPPFRWACESAAIATTRLSPSTVSPSPSGVRINFTTFELPSESDPSGLGSRGLLLSPMLALALCFASHDFERRDSISSKCEVEASGCEVEGSGFEVEGSGCGVEGSGCEVEGSGSKSTARAFTGPTLAGRFPA